jgi:hypothetical protein
MLQPKYSFSNCSSTVTDIKPDNTDDYYKAAYDFASGCCCTIAALQPFKKAAAALFNLAEFLV